MGESKEDGSGKAGTSWTGSVLGEVNWQPPPWGRRLAGRVRSRPLAWLGLPALALVLLASGIAWLLRPPVIPPDAISATLRAPGLTDYDRTPPAIRSLRLRFDGAVAPLEAIGEAGERSREPKGLELSPAHPGTWVWRSDKELVFNPAEDWPVGQDFRLHIDARHAVAPGTTLAQARHAFSTPAFSAQVESAEFYQDPEDASLKRGVYTLSFSHPVDAAQLERRLSLALEDSTGRRLGSPTFATRYDERRLKAWVQSDPLTLPENGGQLKLSLAAGSTASLPGRSRAAELEATLALPALYSVELSGLNAVLVDNARHEPEQVLSLGFNHDLRDSDVGNGARAWLLPERRTLRAGEQPPQRPWPVPYPWSLNEIDEALLAESERLDLQALPPEREWTRQHDFRYQAPPGRRVYVHVAAGLESFGGFRMGKPAQRVLSVPPYPKLLRFVGEGSLLSLRGERRVSIVSRNTDALRLEVGRILPDQLHHLASGHRGSLSEPHLWQLSEDALVERFEKRVTLPNEDPARSDYTGVDLGEFFDARRRGVFLLSLRELSAHDRQLNPEQTLARNAGNELDRRLVVLTDLGVIAKLNLDTSREVFVQSLSGEGPVGGARVAVIARNGETLASAITGADGHVPLPSLDGHTRERLPVMLAVSKGQDLSFLPLGGRQRVLDTSRFDVGGEPNELESGALRAVLFSDRGLYRPGETVNLGLILRAQDWEQSPQGLPMELVVTDPRGSVARRQPIAFGPEGFEEASFTPPQSAPSGPWQTTLYLLERSNRRRAIGTTTIQVREFRPDTMRVRARLSSHNPRGWVHPDGLSAEVSVENLFGTPAQDRRVEGRLNLRPILPSFAGWPGFRFHDPQRASEGVGEDLEAARSDAEGRVSLPLGLERYERATYRLDLLVRAFEPGSGRGVAAQAEALVSEADYLIGVRTPDPLRWIARGEQREVIVVGIGPDGEARAVEGLRAVLVERRFVSVLTRGNDGLYRYVSRPRRDERGEQPLVLDGEPRKLALDTATPGDWTLEIRDAHDTVLNTIDWTVAGNANLSRNLERNAELAITLDRRSYAPGDEIELSLRAPYAGRGVITIERDRVYAHTWFEADTTASVQRIRIPEGIEGNAYVSVQYLRDPDSPEIFTSPLTWGVAPFEIDRDARTLPLALELEERVRPGEPQTITVRSGSPARVSLFVVDEGILQVAGYRVPDPLDHFLRKRMHQVATAQILDLVLPEFRHFQALAAPGGDSEGAGARHLNPFRRRGEAPAVWWSGLVDSDGESGFQLTLPEHFNGRVRVVAVAVSPGRMGIAETTQTIRGDFVLTPTVPTHVAPGDVFEMPVGVANTLEVDGDTPVDVHVEVILPDGMERINAASQPLRLRPGEEGLVALQLRAGSRPGAVPIRIEARSGAHRAQRNIEVSVRPALVAENRTRIGRATRDTPLDDLRRMHDAFSSRRLSASPSPLVAIDGYAHWLDGFAHACTEQLVSRLIPHLVQAKHPELVGGNPGANALADTLDLLRTRQNSEGGFGYWRATMEAEPFVSAWTTLALVEARDRGQRVPADMLDASNRYLRRHAADHGLTALHEQRSRAMAVYLLARQGQQVGDLLATLQTQLERDHPQRWRDDTAGGLVAASFQLLRQERAAAPLANRMRELAIAPGDTDSHFADFSDPLIAQAWRLYLLHRHFPQQVRRLPDNAVESLLDPIREARFNTLSAALAILALEAMDPGDGSAPGLAMEAADGGRHAIGEATGRLVRAEFDAAARRLWVEPADATPAWYVLNESGFDVTAPESVQDRGLEVQRDYLDAEGQPTTSVAVGGELTVRLRLRARGERAWQYVAVSDLLPGGFELVLDTPANASPARQDTDDEETAGADVPVVPTLARPGSSFLPQHAEMREDRVVLYGTIQPQMQEFRYRIRAGSVGEFEIPPVHAESMYRQDVLARGGPGQRMIVVAADEE